MEHGGSVAMNDGTRGNVKVSEHGIGAPTPQELDGVGVDVGVE